MDKIKNIFNSITLFIGSIGLFGIILYSGVAIFIGLIPILLVIIGISAIIVYFNRDKINKISEEINKELNKRVDESKVDEENKSESINENNTDQVQ